MAKTSNVEIVWEDNTDARNYIKYPVYTSLVLAPGDLVAITTSIGTNTCGPATAGNSTGLFAGVSTGYYTAGQLANICTDCVVKATNAGLRIYPGMAVKYSAGDNGTVWAFTACTVDESALGWAMEDIAASGTGMFYISSKIVTVHSNGTALATSDAATMGLFSGSTTTV